MDHAEVLEALDGVSREVVVLVYFDGLSHADAGRQLDLSHDGVGAALSAAYRRLAGLTLSAPAVAALPSLGRHRGGVSPVG